MACIAYRIRLSKNSLVFDTEIVSVHRVLDTTISLATEYRRFDTVTSSIDALAPWNSHVALAASRRVLSSLRSPDHLAL